MRVPPALTATFLHLVYQTLCGTLRFQEQNRRWLDALDAEGQRIVFCLWHDELFPLMRMKKQLDIVTVVSASRDGELLAKVLKKRGMRTARGSSSRGGAAALLGAAKLMLSENVHACITVDGPRGPRHKAKDGAFFLAHHADAFIAPVRLSMPHAVRMHSWDHFQVPLPFSQVVVRHGEPWKIEADTLTDDVIAAARRRLEADLHALASPLPEQRA